MRTTDEKGILKRYFLIALAVMFVAGFCLGGWIYSTKKLPKVKSVESGWRPEYKLYICDRGVDGTNKSRGTEIEFNILFGYSNGGDNNPEFKNELEEKREAVRQIIYKVMGSKSIDELQTDDLGKVQDEMVLRVNTILKKGYLKSISFDKYKIETVE